MATLFIHAGMHKTGSSSIQATLAALPDDRRPALISLNRSGNMSGAIRGAFQPAWRARVAGRVPDGDLDGFGARLRDAVKAQLAAAAGRDAIISAEGLSTLSKDEFRAFMTLVAHDKVSVTAYVRQPYDLLASQLQQRIKAGTRMRGADLVKANLRYRSACRKLMRYPSQLKIYDRARLRNGCVVQDYFHDVGIAIAPEEVVTSNERLTRPAVALLYARNLWRAGRSLPAIGNGELVPLLISLGGPRFELHPAAVEQTIAQYASEVAWASRQLGPDWIASTEPKPHQVRHLSDLLAFGEEAHAFLEAHDPSYQRSDDPDAVGAAMDRIAEGERHRLAAARGAVAADPPPG